MAITDHHHSVLYSAEFPWDNYGNADGCPEYQPFFIFFDRGNCDIPVDLVGVPGQEEKHFCI